MARQLRDAHGCSVAVITNDQGDALVDTAYMKNAGVDVREVLGGCFCSHFDEFVKSARSLVNVVRPDIIIAEPIGTSTNILASVVAPLRDLYPDEFEVAPLFVVLDLSRIDETLKQATSFGLGGGRIIPPHQVHEAEVVLLTKRDLADEKMVVEATARVKKDVPDAAVMSVSARTGDNIEALAQLVLSERTSTKAALGVDNRMFATEKATMGWYSGTAALDCGDRTDVYALCRGILDQVGNSFGGDNIGHVKLVFESESASLKMSLVADSAQVDGIKGGRYAKGAGHLVLNARIMAPPAEIRKTMENALRQSASGMGLALTDYRDSVIKPKPEVPDHFLTK